MFTHSLHFLLGIKVLNMYKSCNFFKHAGINYFHPWDIIKYAWWFGVTLHLLLSIFQLHLCFPSLLLSFLDFACIVFNSVPKLKAVLKLIFEDTSHSDYLLLDLSFVSLYLLYFRAIPNELSGLIVDQQEACLL